MQAVNLSASSYFVPDFSSMQYLNYGAAVSEVKLAPNTFFWGPNIFIRNI